MHTHILYHLRMIPQTAAQWSVTQAINSRAMGNYPRMEPFIPTSGITIQESQPCPISIVRRNDFLLR